LERAGILVRGEKNARVINSLFNDDQIYNILISSSDSDDLPPALLKV
jgi:hypothetical protein